MAGIFITHAHIGHYAGLMFLGREAINAKKLPVMVGSRMKKFLTHHEPWKQLVDLENIKLHLLEENKPMALPKGASITPLWVPHRNEISETFGFLIKGEKKSLLFIPDIDRWEEWQVDIAALLSDVDYCFLDGTFYSEDELTRIGRSYDEIPHPTIENSMRFFKPFVNQCKIYFTHFNHSNPVISDEAPFRNTVYDEGFYLLKEGDQFSL